MRAVSARTLHRDVTRGRDIDEREQARQRKRRQRERQAAGAPVAYCGARTRSGAPCKRPAGHGTPTPGSGRCSRHGGSTPTHQAAVARASVRGLRRSDRRACARGGHDEEASTARVGARAGRAAQSLGSRGSAVTAIQQNLAADGPTRSPVVRRRGVARRRSASPTAAAARRPPRCLRASPTPMPTVSTRQCWDDLTPLMQALQRARNGAVAPVRAAQQARSGGQWTVGARTPRVLPSITQIGQ
jgi:hypothetical protein